MFSNGILYIGHQRQDSPDIGDSGLLHFGFAFFILKDPTTTHHGCWNVRSEPPPDNQKTSATRLTCSTHYSFNSTYYGKDYRAGAALLRARRPYLFKNTLTGLALAVFSIGVCAYSQSQSIQSFNTPSSLSASQHTQCFHSSESRHSRLHGFCLFSPFTNKVLTVCFLCIYRLLHYPRCWSRGILRCQGPRCPREAFGGAEIKPYSVRTNTIEDEIGMTFR